MYYTSVLGAECIALLCSVSRVASASFIKVIFSDVLVSSTLTLPVNIYTWKKKKPCSPGATKIFSNFFFFFNFFNFFLIFIFYFLFFNFFFNFFFF